MSKIKKEIDWKIYPIRKCYSMHECLICGDTIVLGDVYYDGGFGKRAHEKCVITKKNISRDSDV